MKLAEQTKDEPGAGDVGLLSEEELRKAESSAKVSQSPASRRNQKADGRSRTGLQSTQRRQRRSARWLGSSKKRAS
jgi:hypothetical protein